MYGGHTEGGTRQTKKQEERISESKGSCSELRREESGTTDRRTSWRRRLLLQSSFLDRRLRRRPKSIKMFWLLCTCHISQCSHEQVTNTHDRPTSIRLNATFWLTARGTVFQFTSRVGLFEHLVRTLVQVLIKVHSKASFRMGFTSWNSLKWDLLHTN